MNTQCLSPGMIRIQKKNIKEEFFLKVVTITNPAFSLSKNIHVFSVTFLLGYHCKKNDMLLNEDCILDSNE